MRGSREERGLRDLRHIERMVIAAYVEQLGQTHKPPTVKQRLAAAQMLFDWLVVGQVLPFNPASSVRGPKHVVKKGKTPMLDAKQARELLNSIDTSHVLGLRDRALIAVNAEAYLDVYLEAAGTADDKKGALFRTAAGRAKKLTTNRLHRTEALMMIKRRARAWAWRRRSAVTRSELPGLPTTLRTGESSRRRSASQPTSHLAPRSCMTARATRSTSTSLNVLRFDAGRRSEETAVGAFADD
jgi:hypothetical protein